ncbi:uncharacterized protein F4807DRAFT_441811, partial [Annulohypoxylon truncatum]|uniref:uncharacterized protein n=1 Tax=Annulohypoxylon truncatum TaxID=327061 RepID=UPI0020089851
MFDVPGYRVVKVLGAVYGLTVRSRNWAASMGMVLKSIAGGELQWFTSMVCTALWVLGMSLIMRQLYSARNDAISRVVAETKARGGNAIITLRFESGDMGGFAQCSAYGTAAIVEKIDPTIQAAPQLS